MIVVWDNQLPLKKRQSLFLTISLRLEFFVRKFRISADSRQVSVPGQLNGCRFTRAFF